MKTPYPANSPINSCRYRNWLSDFTGYRHSVTEERIDRWIKQFHRRHQDLAARVLDCVDFIKPEQISTAFRNLLSDIEGWSSDPTQRHGKWRFVAFSASAGESGDEMLHKFRIAINLSAKRFNDLFIHKSALMQAKMGAYDTVVFIDDFSGSGKQVCDTWKEMQELLPEGPRVFLLLVVASISAIDRIRNETDICCVSHITLNEGDNIFSEECGNFTNQDQKHLLKYCKIADKKNPKGFGECGFVLVFSHSCPNNTIPILHRCNQKWEGLFRSYG